MSKSLPYAALTVLLPVVPVLAADYYWNPYVPTGPLNDGNCWFNGQQQTGTVPSVGDVGFFHRDSLQVTGTYTMTIPSGVNMDASSTRIRDLLSGTKVVIDATAPGAYWAKVRDGSATWANEIFNIGQADHIFNLEGLDGNDPSDVLGFLFTNGKISYEVKEDGEELVFDGDFNNKYVTDESGTANECRHSTILLHSGRPNARIVFKGGETHLKNTQIRGNGEGDEVVIDGANVHFHNGLYIKTWDYNGDGILRIKSGSAVVESENVGLGPWSNGHAGQLLVQDSGTFVFKGEWFNFDTEGSQLRVSDNATFKLEHDIKFGGHVDAEFPGGTVDATGKELMVTGKSGSNFKFNGANVIANAFVIEGDQAAEGTNPSDLPTHTVEQSTGTVNVNWAFDLRAKRRNAVYMLTGGELITHDMIRLGHGDPAEGGQAIIRQTAGTMRIKNVINFCDSRGTDGTLELLGGKLYGGDIRGWGGCETRLTDGQGGKAIIYGNGGTLIPRSDNKRLIYTVSEVQLGPKGLTVDTDNMNAQIEAKFVNKTSENGLLVKTGNGALRVVLKETDGEAKGEFAGRSLIAEHTATRIEKGTLEVTEGGDDAKIGDNVTVLGGATLALGENVNRLTVKKLSLGDGHGFAKISLSGDQVVIVTESLEATCGAIEATWAGAKGTHPVFVCAFEPQITELAKIAIAGADPNCDYSWTIADYADGLKVCSMIVADAGTASRTVTYTSSGKSTEGSESNPIAHINALASQIESGDVPLAYLTTADVANGATLNITGPLVGTGVELMKSGAGTLQLSGDNSDFFGSLYSNGGILEVLNRGALGPTDLYFPLSLGNGTFRYAGEPATFEGALQVRTPACKQQAVLENTGDLTFKSVDQVRGAFVKQGSGTLTFDLPAGTHALVGQGDDNLGWDGENGLHGFNILEGTVKVKGEGADQTTFQMGNCTLLGGNYLAKTAPVLEIEDAYVRFGHTAHGHIAQNMPEGALAPELRMKNAELWSDSFKVGTEGTMDAVKVRLEDSTISGHYECWIGNFSCSADIKATNSVMQANRDGWTLSGPRVTAEFIGPNAAFASTETNETDDRRGRITADYGVKGELTFRDGARLETTRGLRWQNTDVNLVFDGGIFRLNKHDNEPNSESKCEHDNVRMVTEGDGLTFDICEGSTHTLPFTIEGEGAVTKTGAGTLVLTKEIDKRIPLTVAQGALSFNTTEVEIKSLAVAGGAAVAYAQVKTDELKLTAGQIPNFLYATFANAKQQVTIDFGEATPNVTKNQKFEVAKFYADQNGTPIPAEYLDVSGWRGMAKGYTRQNLGGRGGEYFFTYDANTGTLFAEYVPKKGFTITIR